MIQPSSAEAKATSQLQTALFGAAMAATPLLAQTVSIDYDHAVTLLIDKYRPKYKNP
jgi:hypothetical protein